MRAPLFVLLALAVAGASCGDDSTGVTAPSPFAGAATEVFSTTLSPGGSKFYSFQMVQQNPVAITLTSTTVASSGAVLSNPVKVGLGVPSGTDCGLFTSATAPPALSAQLSTTLAGGIYCVQVSDLGVNLTADINFSVRITQGTLRIFSTASPENFSSNLAKGGSSIRTFTAASGGTATVKLDGVAPSVVVGLAIGAWRDDTSVCSITQTVNSSGGAQFTVPIDQGQYCVRVFDVGNVTDFVFFSVGITHPQ